MDWFSARWQVVTAKITGSFISSINEHTREKECWLAHLEQSSMADLVIRDITALDIMISAFRADD